MHSTAEANNALISIILLNFYLKHVMQPLGNVILIHSPVGVNTTFQVVRWGANTSAIFSLDLEHTCNPENRWFESVTISEMWAWIISASENCFSRNACLCGFSEFFFYRLYATQSSQYIHVIGVCISTLHSRKLRLSKIRSIAKGQTASECLMPSPSFFLPIQSASFLALSVHICRSGRYKYAETN